MVDRVLDALAESRCGTTFAVVSPHASETREYLAEIAAEDPDVRLIDAPGDGYVADLQYAMERVGPESADGAVDAAPPPLLTVAADLPLVDAAAVNGVIDAARAAGDDDAPSSLTLCVPAARKREIGVNADASTEIDGREVVPAGINVVGGSEEGDESDESGEGDEDDESDKSDDETDRDDAAVHLTEDVRLAVNVNYPSDVQAAERLLADGEADD